MTPLLWNQRWLFVFVGILVVLSSSSSSLDQFFVTAWITTTVTTTHTHTPLVRTISWRSTTGMLPLAQFPPTRTATTTELYSTPDGKKKKKRKRKQPPSSSSGETLPQSTTTTTTTDISTATKTTSTEDTVPNVAVVAAASSSSSSAVAKEEIPALTTPSESAIPTTTAATTTPVKPSQDTNVSGDAVKANVLQEDDDDDDDEEVDDDLLQIAKVAKYRFQPDDTSITKGIQDNPNVVAASTDVSMSSLPSADALSSSSSVTEDDGMIPLPDIRSVLKRKEEEEKLAQEMLQQQEQEQQKSKKIKRSDKKALAKLLEQQPYADADDSLFEAEAYDTVSALLGEGAKSFLGIPFAPLQIGHLIGALALMLMAFVEYPGFPLTNLPTPIRVALQGGLGVVYTINLLLGAAVAFVQAPSRKQSSLLWAAKTLAVGGLALDQLTQLPLEENNEKTSSSKSSSSSRRNR